MHNPTISTVLLADTDVWGFAAAAIIADGLHAALRRAAESRQRRPLARSPRAGQSGRHGDGMWR